MLQVADLFPETLGEEIPRRRFESTLKSKKWNSPLAIVELRPKWDAVKGVWVVGWFCHVNEASADEWLPGQVPLQGWPWYRPNNQPSGKELDVACAVAARAIKIVLTQIKEYAHVDGAQAATELIDLLEVEARRWLGAIQ